MRHTAVATMPVKTAEVPLLCGRPKCATACFLLLLLSAHKRVKQHCWPHTFSLCMCVCASRQLNQAVLQDVNLALL